MRLLRVQVILSQSMPELNLEGWTTGARDPGHDSDVNPIVIISFDLQGAQSISRLPSASFFTG